MSYFEKDNKSFSKFSETVSKIIILQMFFAIFEFLEKIAKFGISINILIRKSHKVTIFKHNAQARRKAAERFSTKRKSVKSAISQNGTVEIPQKIPH